MSSSFIHENYQLKNRNINLGYKRGLQITLKLPEHFSLLGDIFCDFKVMSVNCEIFEATAATKSAVCDACYCGETII